MRQITVAPLVLLAGTLGACAAQPFYRTDTPSAAEGVSVAPLSQRCGRRFDNPRSDVLHLNVTFQITNRSDAPAVVMPGDLRLLVGGDVTAPAKQDPPTEIGPGASREVAVRFVRYGDATCNQPMQLSLDHAVRLRDRELPLRPLSVVPNRSDT